MLIVRIKKYGKKYIAKKSAILFDNYIEYIITALGLVTALSWNSPSKNILNKMNI